jgi:hypothetical protein
MISTITGSNNGFMLMKAPCTIDDGRTRRTSGHRTKGLAALRLKQNDWSVRTDDRRPTTNEWSVTRFSRSEAAAS